jgi:gluconolactonase
VLFRSPNDIVVRSDGSIYFTDPPFGIRPDQVELGFSGIYRISTEGELALLSTALERPNGLAFSLDERHLYVDDSTAKKLHCFAVTPAGMLEDGRLVLDMDNGMPGNPDGMKLDQGGNLYIAGPGGVWVVSGAMEQLGLIQLPELPSNCAWGDDGHSLYVTARRSLYRVRCRSAGAFPGSPAQ